MAIAPKGAGSEIGIHIRTVWMGSHQAALGLNEDISYAPAVVIYKSSNGVNCVFPLNPDMSTQMRDRFLVLAQERAKPKTASERYKASKEKGLHFRFDTEEAGIFVADRSALPLAIPWAAGSLSFKSRGVNGVEVVAFSREEFATFADVLTRAIDTFAG